MKRPPQRNATRKPELYQRDAHVWSWVFYVEMLLGLDPEDFPPGSAQDIDVWAAWTRHWMSS